MEKLGYIISAVLLGIMVLLSILFLPYNRIKRYNNNVINHGKGNTGSDGDC